MKLTKFFAEPDLSGDLTRALSVSLSVSGIRSICVELTPSSSPSIFLALAAIILAHQRQLRPRGCQLLQQMHLFLKLYSVKIDLRMRKQIGVGFEQNGLESGKSSNLLRNKVRLRTQRPCVRNQYVGQPSVKESEKTLPIAKMCGITSAKDAEIAARVGASLIGMILWPKSKRSVSTNVAKEISKVSREHGVEPVGVFVDDDADTILRAYDALDLEYVQLHGNDSRAAFPLLFKQSRVIYVLHADENGGLLNHITDEQSSLVDWLLVDSATGGSGKGFDRKKFRKPSVMSKCGWLLAGGLNSENVCEAIATLRPDGVDVSSGICGPDGIQKDPRKMSSFIDNVRSLSYHA